MAWRARLWRLAVLSIALLLLVPSISAEQQTKEKPLQRSIQIGLHASWPNTRCSAEAVSWIGSTIGDVALMPFLHALAKETSLVTAKDSDETTNWTPNSEREEHAIVFAAAKHALENDALLLPMLNWALSARQMSARVSLHYSLASDALSVFRPHFPVAVSTAATSHVFAVLVDRSAGSAQLAVDEKLCRAVQCPVLATSISGTAVQLGAALPHDHILFPRCNLSATSSVVIVYANVASRQFVSWVSALEGLDKCAAKYILRLWVARSMNSEAVFEPRPGLQGYSVDVSLKKTEYKVVDDRVFETRLFDDCEYSNHGCSSTANETQENMALESWTDKLKSDNKLFPEIDVTQHVINEANGSLQRALSAMRDVAEDGPAVMYSSAWATKTTHDKKRRKAFLGQVAELRGSPAASSDVIFVNGRPLPASMLKEDFGQVLSCLSSVASAAKLLRSVRRYDSDSSNAASGSFPTSGDDSSVADPVRVNLSLSDKPGEGILAWFNDLENDARYKTWASIDSDDDAGLREFIAHAKSNRGMGSKNGDHLRLAKVRANLLGLLIVLDPGNPAHIPYLAIPEQLVRGGIPMRVGIVLVPNGHVSSLFSASFYYFLREHGRKRANQFLSGVRRIMDYMGGGYQQVPLSAQLVELSFEQVSRSAGAYSSAAEVLEKDEGIKRILENASAWAESMGLLVKSSEFGSESEEGSNIQTENKRSVTLLGSMNGVVLRDIAADVITVAFSEQERVARMLEKTAEARQRKPEGVHEILDCFEKWVSSDDSLLVVNRISKSMLPQVGTTDNPSVHRLALRELHQHREELSSLAYLRPEPAASPYNEVDKVEKPVPKVTVWLASNNFSSPLTSRSKSFLSEVASDVVFVQRSGARFANLPQSSGLGAMALTCKLGSVCADEAVFILNGRRVAASSVESADDLKAEVAAESAAWTSPKMVSSVPLDRSFSDWDLSLFDLAANFDVDVACKGMGEGASEGVDHLETLLSTLSKASVSDFVYPSSLSVESVKLSPFSVVAVVDPYGMYATSAGAFMRALIRAFGSADDNMLLAGLIVLPAAGAHLNMREPRMVFSRFLMDPIPSFDVRLGHRISPSLRFHRLAQESVQTVAVDSPRPWFVSAFATNYDMDNVILESLPTGVSALHAEYELTSLLVEGSCIDETQAPPQGLKLILNNKSGTSVDTLVMANLGYFQLKVPSPGRWHLSLAPGASMDVFDIKSIEFRRRGSMDVFTSDATGRISLLVDSLNGASGGILRVVRKSGMEGVSVLNPRNAGGKDSAGNVVRSLKSKLQSFYKRSSTVTRNEPKQQNAEKLEPELELINVFSVASGHLYERFLKIMMLSVTQHASRPVKFWLLENYLSPSFKKMLPHFAKRHGFQVEMVTYRWPGWLREQTEKQRIIWAYKILFLDVLFPLDVGRIIFVDSDQVVRGDLAELMDMNLQGAPYGYVPFCDSRKEVEGYRFWKQGFWKDALRGAKYRISALYVVDLVRFRETAAGDTLRFVYQSLSADPNSLSNLDQDLPNYASVAQMAGTRAVPIFDLPQEWLWCESWCDDGSKASAKAIDLCNNPMTKEPKLQSAKRIIDEWTTLDDTASADTKLIYEMLAAGIKSPDVQLSDTQSIDRPFDEVADVDPPGAQDTADLKTEL